MKDGIEDEIALGHPEVCRWLAQLFLFEVTADQMAAYQSGAAEPFLDCMASVCEITEGRAAFEAAIVGWGDLETPLRTVAADYAALFLLGEKANAQPYASLFSEGTGQVFGAAHDRMVARLSSQGLGLSAPTNEPADHISFLLEYLSVLLGSPKSGQETPADFLNAEILPWFDRWAQAASRVPVRSRFYPELISLSQRYLAALAKE
ncbi:molecular chaperone TorD family protein [Shimia haliotis]|uniref:TorA specific chaperone n=1 Tax=Shimia haliotis TaxID=1280847 RepID=A0A1I4FNE9_9RHOB|nr:molecular chaperone TorD family protein [Shimia haliotis]SFL19053.1 TorA specific chaperone [Shimia haliotis]